MKHDENTDRFLRDQMSVAHLDLQEPKLTLVQKARNKVLARKQFIPREKKAPFFMSLFFQYEVKLYQVLLAGCCFILVFYFAGINEPINQKIHQSQLAPNDSLGRYSVKSTMFLVKNFSEQVN